MPIILLILCWPFIEIAGFIIVGERIGILPTIGLTILSSVIGALLLRYQGISVLRKMQAELAARRMPAAQLGHGAFITFAGFCLLVPGFASDIIGLLLFVPPVRSLLLGFLARNVQVVVQTTGSFRSRTVDLDPDEWHAANARPAPGAEQPVRHLKAPDHKD